MARLEIDFNCMCVFVPDERAKGVGTVHVLMPTTHDHQHSGDRGGDGGDGNARQRVSPHVVRMLHSSFKDEPKGRSMEGWALVLGEDRATGNTRLKPPRRPRKGDTIVDLTDLSGQTLERRLVQDRINREVNARVTLRAGRVTDVTGEANWLFKGVSTRMAFRVTWLIDDVPEDRLTWVHLGATRPPPVRSLEELGADDDGVYRFSIYHVPLRALPPRPNGLGRLSPRAVKDHFRALYAMFGITNPDESILPQIDPGHGGFVHCGTGRGSLR